MISFDIFKRQHKTKKPLKRSMIGLLLMAWLLPLMLIVLIMLGFIFAMLSEQIEKTISLSADKAVEICEVQMEEAIKASKNASYMSTVKESYGDYLENGDKDELYKQITNFLNQQYKYDESFLCTMLFFLDGPDQVYHTYNTYMDNNTSSGGYKRVEYFRSQVMELVMEKGKSLETGVEFVEYEGHLYLIRNIIGSDYIPYAMIVIELDVSSTFQSINTIWGMERYDIFIDGASLLGTQMSRPIDESQLLTITPGSVYSWKQNYAYVYKVISEGEGQNIAFFAELDSQAVFSELYMLRYIIILFGGFSIPLVLLIYFFFDNRVTKPMGKLIEASKQIRNGHYGFVITDEGNSKEFVYLNEAYNMMSIELQHQFEQIYLEELALRDAEIDALQSQINPHFLNNTLEIINWENRKSGNEKVCGMIEALSTMLNFNLNREKQHFITLSEELTYVDAYIYIISKRFESRFAAEREIDESLLKIEVPRLIIQPIVENAVEHGISARRRGKVKIRIYGEADKLMIEITNDGALSLKDEERIRYLLNPEVDNKQKKGKKEKHISLGIKNVNRRLKIIYGEECGLSIRSNEQEQTVSTLVLKKQIDLKQNEKDFIYPNPYIV